MLIYANKKLAAQQHFIHKNKSDAIRQKRVPLASEFGELILMIFFIFSKILFIYLLQFMYFCVWYENDTTVYSYYSNRMTVHW